MIYPIVLYGDPILKKKAADIAKDEVDVKQLAEDMFETMRAASGIGLAAPQIGKPYRMFIVDGEPLEDPQMKDFQKVFINPIIENEEGENWPFEEGCLSIPEIREEVKRAEKLSITYFDENWDEHTEQFDGMKARIIQHEYDHIEGILFTDHLTPFKKQLLKGKLQNISRGRVSTNYKVKAPGKK
jgi:peptide deformylase